MRRRGRIDTGQREIVAALRAAGCSVLSLASVGSNVPDLLVGRAGVNYLLEVKPADRAMWADNLAKRVRLRDQAEWRARWRGPSALVSTPAEALQAVGFVGP